MTSTVIWTLLNCIQMCVHAWSFCHRWTHSDEYLGQISIRLIERAYRCIDVDCWIWTSSSSSMSSFSFRLLFVRTNEWMCLVDVRTGSKCCVVLEMLIINVSRRIQRREKKATHEVKFFFLFFLVLFSSSSQLRNILPPPHIHFTTTPSSSVLSFSSSLTAWLVLRTPQSFSIGNRHAHGISVA